jgi:hypothetical protein
MSRSNLCVRLAICSAVRSLGYECHHQQNLKTMRGERIVVQMSELSSWLPLRALFVVYSLGGARPQCPEGLRN